MMGKSSIERIYRYADVFHCEPIEKTADDFIVNLNIPEGNFDNVTDCRYMLPDYWTIGEVYTSWIDGAISNYNTDFYYQSRDYIYECYKEGRVLE